MQLFRFLTGARPPLIERSLRSLDTMLETSAEMFTAATNCLLDNDPVRVDLAALDDKVNDHEQAIRRAVLEHVVADPQSDTAFSLLLVAIVQDAERCGDLAKSIAKASELAAGPRMGRRVEALRPIRDRVRDAFPRTRQAFAKADTSAARAVMEDHDQTKADVAAYLQTLASDPEVGANEAVVLAVASRMIGRTSSHLSNIISAVALPFDQVRNSPTWETNA